MFLTTSYGTTSSGTRSPLPVTLGIVHEIEFTGSGDVDLTLDPADTSRTLGPIRELYVLSGTGSLAYVDGVHGETRTLTSLAAGTGGELCARTLLASGSTFTGRLRVMW